MKYLRYFPGEILSTSRDEHIKHDYNIKYIKNNFYGFYYGITLQLKSTQNSLIQDF